MHTDWMDPLMYLVSHKLFWVPFYVVLFFLIQRKFGWKGLGFFVVGIALVVLFCDQLSSSVFKPLFARYRPCNNLDIMDVVHRVNNRCGSGFSFVSGHATNFFGISMFTALLYKDMRLTVPLLIWAALIAYSRIYLGVHYPADVLAGATLGIILGTNVYLLYKWLVPVEHRT